MLLLIIGQECFKAFLRNPANGVGFIQLFDDAVQLTVSLAVFVKLSSDTFGRFRLPDVRGFSHLANKCLLVFDRLRGGGADRF